MPQKEVALKQAPHNRVLWLAFFPFLLCGKQNSEQFLPGTKCLRNFISQGVHHFFRALQAAHPVTGTVMEILGFPAEEKPTSQTLAAQQSH